MNQSKTKAAKQAKIDTDKMDLGPSLTYLLSIVSYSANLCYRDISGLNDLEWRIIMRLGEEPQTSKEIQVAIERDKAQISRVLKGMEESGLLSRSKLRAPYILTKQGQRISQKLVTLAGRRNGELLGGVSEKDSQWFHVVLQILCGNAQKVIVTEKELVSVYGVGHGESVEAIKVAGSPQILFHLYRLLVLIRRVASTVYRNEIGITGFETQVLVSVKHMQPLSATNLSKTLGRDKGQIARIVKKLCEDGLLDRCARTGTKRKDIALTDKGQKTYDQLARRNKGMDKKLLAGLNKTEGKRLSKLISKLIVNAKAMYMEAQKLSENEHSSGAWDVSGLVFVEK